MSYEVECKIYVRDLEAMQQRLETVNAHITHPRVYEHNIRYESPANDFRVKNIVLRLRQDSRVRLTYKGPGEIDPSGVMKRLELETEIGDFAAMDHILKLLGYTPYMMYEKYRTTYALPDFAPLEIVLDEMPFGNFIEVEGTTETIDLAIEQLGLSDRKRIPFGYQELFARVLSHYQLHFRDLSFENFQDLDISEASFYLPRDQ